jgi:hypothetical protein
MRPIIKKSAAKNICLVPLLILIAACGCNRKPENEGTLVSAPQPTAPPPGLAVPDSSVAGTTLNGEVNPALTKLLRGFIRQKGHLPRDIDELAQARTGEIPEPPAGKKWGIDFQTTEVKAISGP